MKNNKKDTINFVARQAIVMAMYVLLTIVNPLSFDNIQFRISEILVLLCFYKKDYIVGLGLGCLIANLFSPMMIYDITFGLGATLIALALICVSKNIYVAGIWPVLVNAIIVGLELHLAYQLPIVLTMIQVGVGELVVIIVGIVIFKILEKNKKLMFYITNDRTYEE